MYCFKCMNPIGNDGYCPYCQSLNQAEAAPHHLKPGTVLNDKYVVGKALGEGGFGITYIGRDLTLDVKVAIKEYYPNGYVNRNNSIDNVISPLTEQQVQFYQQGKERFLQEARSLAKFSNEKGVVLVRDYFESCGSAYIVMEYLDGITLQQYLRHHKTIEATAIFRLMLPIITSLEKMHAAGIIHRDISPDNIMYLNDGTLKLMDFGSARYFTNGDKEMSVMIKQGYAPEEQYRRNGSQGPWTDVYGLCATIYKCITGTIPEDSLNRLHYDNLRRPSELGVGISPRLEAVLMYGLAVRQNDRCRDMTELKMLVTDALDNPAGAYPEQYSQGNTYPTELVNGQSGANGAPSATYGDDYYHAQGMQQTVPAQPPKKKKSAAPIIITIVAVVVLLGIGAAVYFLLNSGSDDSKESTSSQEESQQVTDAAATDEETEAVDEDADNEEASVLVEVPDLVGMSSAKAIETLTEAGLQANPVQVPDSSHDKDQVINQKPKSGSKAAPDSEVVIYISEGPEDGEEQQEATTKNEDADDDDDADSDAAETVGKTLYCRTDSVTLRDIPSREGEKVATIKENEKVTYIATENDFYKVKYQGKEGYVLSEFFSEDPDAPFNSSLGNLHNGSIVFSKASGDLHLRASPSTSAKSLATINPRDKMTLVELKVNGSGFDKVIYDGIEGYVLDKFLTDNPYAKLLDDEV